MHPELIVENLNKDVEILVIGGGIIGSALAMHLGQMGAKKVRVVDLDLEGELSSSELNAGGVRATFSQPINVELSKASIDYFASVANEVGYRACGYLWLKTPESIEIAVESKTRYDRLGWPTEIWDVNRLREQIPFIDKTDDLAGALFAPRDGLINSNRLKNHFREEAKLCGVEFVDRFYLDSYNAEGIVSGRKFQNQLSRDERIELFKNGQIQNVQSAVSSKKVEFKAEKVVNCTGAWAGPIAEKLGYKTHSKAIRRQVALFDCREVDLNKYGMIVDTSGVYFHPEATYGMSGVALPNEKEGVDFNFDGESYFMHEIWVHLHERATAFERLKFLSGWAGLYEISPDESAIIGQVNSRVYESHSYSGHGVMHAYATGKGLAEKILKGKYESFDLSLLSGDRFDSGKLVSETAVI